ncbi:sulfatase [Telmatobacter sp. DSM 110680]|uniref:Sulfatase n=1 Tax=Telmatobacter sp. DSM 110680 TaxID=3036704 RepID=A0AAU7DN92_9BACT
METRRTVLKYLTGAAGASACSFNALESFARQLDGTSKRPNIVCIVGEGLRWDELSSTGNKLIKTPNLDRIGREGCTFKNAFVVNALCLPSRATMLTGMYSHTTGAVSNVEGKIPPRFPLVSDLLQQAGYETAFLGKSHIEGALMEHNWDYYFGFVGQADYYRPKITEGVRGKYGPAKLYEGEYVDTLLTQKAIAWLKQERTKPFCLFLWFYAPHAPFYRPKDLVNDLNGVSIPKPKTFDENLNSYKGKPRAVADADNKIGYSEVFSDDPRSLEELVKNHYVGVEDNDRNMGAVWQELERQKIANNTAVLLSSDHGFFLGEHHLYDKRLMYEPSIRVPMIVSCPGRVQPGSSSNEMVLNLDIAPTLLQIAGVAVPAEMQGKSMMPLAEGKGVPWRKDWLYEYYEYPGFENVRPCRGVRTDRYKFIHFFVDPQEFELYDLQTDPDEMNNLYGKPEFAELTTQLKDRMTALRAETNDTYQYKPSGIPLHWELGTQTESGLKRAN